MIRTLILVGSVVLALGGFAASTAMATQGGHVPVTICHKPGTPAEHTIVVDESAVAAHLAHGDYLGPCYSDTTTGDTGTTTEDPPPTTTDEPVCSNIDEIPEGYMFDGSECVPTPPPGPASNPDKLDDGTCPKGTEMVLSGDDDVTAPLFTCVDPPAGSTPTSGDLPYTGLPVWLFALAGFGALIGGTLVLLGSRRDH